MEFFKPRKHLFKAWNTESRLLMRLNSIDCKRGELYKKDHILLQFTGMLDKQDEEIYEMDVLLIGGEKLVVMWDADHNTWHLGLLKDPTVTQVFSRQTAEKSTRLWSYFESEKNA